VYIPDLSRSCETDPAFPPHCSAIVPRRKPPGATFLWTLSLAWAFSDEDVADLSLPAPFSRDRGDILAAIGGEGPAYRRTVELRREVMVDLKVCVGSTKLPVLAAPAPGIIKRVEVAASEGGGTCKVLLVVELTRNSALEMMDVIDADLDLIVRTQEDLPFTVPPVPENGDAELEDDEEETEAEAESEVKPPPRDARRRPVMTASSIDDDDLPAEA
jgi:hypothetical protein